MITFYKYKDQNKYFESIETKIDKIWNYIS